MKIVIDTDTGRLMVAGPEGMRDLPLYSAEGLAVLKQLMEQVARQQAGTQVGPAARQSLTLIAVGTISPALVSNLARSAQISFIVVGGDLLPHDGPEPIRRISGGITSAETQIQIRAAIPADAKAIVALRINAEKSRARQELEACAEFVSVGSFLAVTGSEPATGSSGQLEQPDAVTEFAMEHGEFRLMKSPVSSDAGSFWLQRVK